MKECAIDDEWQKFKVEFTVFHPMIDEVEEMWITGNCDELGNWSRAKQVKMKKCTKSELWLNEKYGETIKPYTVTVSFMNNRKLLPGQPFILE